MNRDSTGRYEIDNSSGETVRAFIPNPLPPDPPLEVDSLRLQLLERASLALGRLDSITDFLPDPDLFLYAYIRREAVLSSQIEGTQSSLSELMLFEVDDAPGVPVDDVVEVSNYVDAMTHGMQRLGELPLCNRLIREMHGKLLQKGRGSEKSPGEFRRTQNWIGGTRPGKAHYVPPPPQYVDECMSSLEQFLHQKNSYPTLIMAALAHVQFETIHPFLDGNGRIGRLLISFVLHHAEVLSNPLLYLSLYFKQNRSEYYRLLDVVRTEGNWEAWIDFFLEGVRSTAVNAEKTAQRLVNLFREDENKIDQLGRAALLTRNIFRFFRERPVINPKNIAKRAGVTPPSVNKGIAALLDLGIIEEITGKQRYRIYAYKHYLAILNEDAEPIQ